MGVMLLMATGLFIVYYNSGRFSNTYGELEKEIQYRYEKKLRADSGSWYTNKWEMYHTLSFEPGNFLTINNSIDTVFHFNYSLHNDTLWLMAGEGQKTPYRIKAYSNMELIFESLLSAKREMKYTRVKMQQ